MMSVSPTNPAGGAQTGPADVHEARLWLGSQRPRHLPAPTWRAGFDGDLHDLVVSRKRPLLIAARNSDARTRKGSEAAAADAHDAVVDLARLTGFDLTRTLPSRDIMADWLFSSPNVQRFTEPDGTAFSMRTCLIDLTEHGVLLCLSSGSALKLTTDHQQPHVTLIQQILRSSTIDLAGVFVKRFDRLSRSTSMLVVHELRDLERRLGISWSGDGEQGRWDLGEMAEVIATIKGIGGRAEGLAMRRKAVAGIRRETHDRMIDGRVRYSLGGGCPPGLIRYRDRITGRSYLAIDSPVFHPALHDSLSGVPDVRDQDGQLVDQAATLQWILANFGVDGRDEHALFPELLARRWSTDGLRRERSQGPSAYWGGPTKPVNQHWPRRWFRAIEQNLDLYETGRIVRKVRTSDDEPLVINNIFPASGAWARPEDFERIRSFLRNRPALRSHASWSWSGLEASVNGEPVHLEPDVNPARDGEFSWILSYARPGRSLTGGHRPEGTDTDARSAHRRPPSGHRYVADNVLTAALIEALIAHNGKPLRPFLNQANQSHSTALLVSERDRVEAELAAGRRRQEAQLTLILEVDANGLPVMPESLRHRAYADWGGEQDRLQELDLKRQRLHREVAAAMVASPGVTAPAMQALVASLRNPASSGCRTVLRDAVRNLAFAAEPVAERHGSGTAFHFTGDLVFATSKGPHSVPFSGHYVSGYVTKLPARRLKAISLLRAGSPPASGDPGWVGMSPTDALRAFGGPSGNRASIVACEDAALLRLGMAALFPELAPGEDPAEAPSLTDLYRDPELLADFVELDLLADRIRTYYLTTGSRTWVNPSRGGKGVTYLLIAEATGAPVEVAKADKSLVALARKVLHANGRFASGAWAMAEAPNARPRPAPCHACGGAARASMIIGLPVGHVCLNPDCRRDEAGIRWPTRFDRYIARADMWSEAGFELDLAHPSEAAGQARDAIGRKARVAAASRLSPHQRQSLIASYLDTSMTVRQVLAGHDVTHTTLMTVLRADNIPRRGRSWRPPTNDD